MATKTSPEPQVTHFLPDYASQPMGQPVRSSAFWNVIVTILTPLASLKLTVALFVMSIFIVFAGTLAQTEKDIWQVVHDYFRMDLTSFSAALQSALAWIDFRIFFPPSFFPNMPRIPWGYGFYFPSGWLIGMVMFLNLMAAHFIRFRVQGRGKSLAAGLVVLVLGILLTVVVVAAGSQQTATQLSLFTDWPSLRILWLLTQCTAVSVTLVIASWLIFGKRSGIVVLHAGVGLMMFGELVVGVAAVEGQMQIVEGRTVNYVMDTRKMELAFVDSSDAQVDDVAVIPQALLLQPDRLIQDAQLPVDVEIVTFLPNSARQPANPSMINPATAGMGLGLLAVPTELVSGTDNSGQANQPALYARLLKKGTQEALGVYLFGLEEWLGGRTERVAVDGKPYEVSLRYKHMYKPYSMHLIDVEQDVYMGTQMAKSYSSQLRLVDSSRNVDRTVKIWMNNPLRFAGETFYQSNYGRDARSGTEYTGLQVVTNTGWRIPYVSCMMMAVGMFVQFVMSLSRYLRRSAGAPGRGEADYQAPGAQDAPHARRGKAAQQPVTAHESSEDTGGAANWLVPLGIVLLSGLWLLSKAYIPKPDVGQLDLNAFGRLPVMFEGRIKPIDTLARNSLRIVSDRQVYRDENGDTQPAISWLLDVITDSPAAGKQRVFRIQNLELLDTLGLERRSGFRYAIDEFLPKLDVFGEQVRQARMTEPAQRGVYEKKVLELQQRLNHYVMLIESFRPAPLRVDSVNDDLAREMSRREMNGTLPLAVPPKDPEGEWQPYSFAEFDARARSLVASQGVEMGSANPATEAWTRLLQAYGDKSSDAAAFNSSVANYWGLLQENPPREWRSARTNFEEDYNHLSPFYYATILYVGAAVLGFFSWLGWCHLPLRRAATWLALFTFVVHTLALIARMYISGRPPVTSLYSSLLFVGWAGVGLAILLEFYSRLGVANVVGAILGFATLMYSEVMANSLQGDSFTVLVAVLDTQFWLATHVVCVTIGYSATLLAGLLGAAYIVRGVVTSAQDPAPAKELSRMIYGTVCFAVFFSFFGTVLGGLWADDSWGRFWGWDPKENGALIIVLWNAVVLHAYWGRMVRQRGLAVLAIVGNIVTLWSWFGVNELGVGLHSYGFTEGVLLTLGAVIAGHLGLIALGLVPERRWRSHVPT